MLLKPPTRWYPTTWSIWIWWPFGHYKTPYQNDRVFCISSRSLSDTCHLTFCGSLSGSHTFAFFPEFYLLSLLICFFLAFYLQIITDLLHYFRPAGYSCRPGILMLSCDIYVGILSYFLRFWLTFFLTSILTWITDPNPHHVFWHLYMYPLMSDSNISSHLLGPRCAHTYVQLWHAETRKTTADTKTELW